MQAVQARLRRRFVREAQAMADLLRQLGERRDAAQLGVELHRLRGAAHMLGFAELAEACATAERQAMKTEAADPNDSFNRVLGHLEVTSRSPFPDAELAADTQNADGKDTKS